MRILDRYILKSILSLFFACIFVFLFLYVIIDVLSNLEELLKQQTSLSLLIKYYLSYLPIMFMQIAPFACLLSTLYTFGKLSHDNEVIAMRSSGLSIYQITKTAIVFGFLVSLFVFWLNDKFIPQTLSFTQKIKSQMEQGVKKEKKQETIYNLTMYGAKNRLFFINKFLTTKNIMEGIVILEHDEQQNITKKIIANKGIYEDNYWKFYRCITYNFDPNGQITQEPQYLEEEIMDIPEAPYDFISQRQRPEFMTIAQLDDYIWKLSKSGASAIVRNFKVDFYQRFTSPFTSVIIILLAVPFSFIKKRRATGLSSIGLSIMVGFLYYILEAISIALGKTGMLTPILAASLSHIIMLFFSLYLIQSLP
jgi:lipopolysaccharide export system permease protein